MNGFDAAKVKDAIVEWIRSWFEANGNGCNAVVGISGGKDSSVVAALCVEALGKDRVIGVLMPNGTQKDIYYSYKLIRELGIKSVELDIAKAVNGVLLQMILNNIHASDQTRINLPARIRMATLYAVSQSMNGRVANTCNLSEDWVGYATRYGDSVGDFSPLSQLTTDEVIAIGEACGLSEELTRKVPSDGLCGKTDEDNLGFTYAVLNEYIRTGICEDEAIRISIDEMHRKNLFKLQPMPCFNYANHVSSLVPCTFVSSWDDGVEIWSEATMNVADGTVFDIHTAQLPEPVLESLEVLQREYVVVGDEEYDVVRDEDNEDLYHIKY